MKVGNKILGLAIGQKSILVAEVLVKGQRHAVSRCAEFVFPDGQSMSTPDKLGVSFHQFLKSKQFSTKDVIIGLPAKRLVTRRKEVPPATAAAAANTLRVQAEGEFSSELDNLVMDFAGTPSTAESTTVLLIATNKVLVDECEALARAAGLHVFGITSTTAALGRATSRLPGGDGLVLNIGPHGAELVVQHGLDPAHLRHLNVVGGTDSIVALAAEIRRMMAAIPRNGTPQTLALWNSGTAENPQGVLEQRLSMPVTMPEVSNLVVTDTAGTEGYGPAVALALSAMEPGGLPVDFLHSRMAPPSAPGLSIQKKLGIAGGVLLAAVVAFAYIDLSSRQSDVDALKNAIAKDKPALAIANAEIKRFDELKSLLRLNEKAPTAPREPVFDAVLRDLTADFTKISTGARGNSIWATDIANRRDAYTWELQGKAVNEQYPRLLNAEMLRDGDDNLFENPQLSVLFEPQENLYGFRLSFTYKGVGYKPPATAPSRVAAPRPDAL